MMIHDDDGDDDDDDYDSLGKRVYVHLQIFPHYFILYHITLRDIIENIFRAFFDAF
jgi:hypothetical protein